MKVLLKEDVDNLGYAGDIADVANGYGRNYLIPQGLAVKATAAVLREARAWRERAAVRRAELQAEYEALSGRIEETTLQFMAKAGESGKLYGSVTTMDIADRLNEVLGTDIDRRKVISEPLRQLGEHKVIVRLSTDFQPNVTVQVEQESEEPEEVADAEAAAAADAELAESAAEPAEEAEVEAVEEEASAAEAVAEVGETVDEAEEADVSEEESE